MQILVVRTVPTLGFHHTVSFILAKDDGSMKDISKQVAYKAKLKLNKDNTITLRGSYLFCLASLQNLLSVRWKRRIELKPLPFGDTP